MTSNDDMRVRIAAGEASVRAGAMGEDDPATDLTDALANIMHFARARGIDFDASLATAEEHANIEFSEWYRSE